MGSNSDGSVEIFVADTTILSPTVPGRTVRQVTESNGNILGGFNIMPDVACGQVSEPTPTVRTYAVFASDRDLEPGKNSDGGFEIFLAETEPTFRIWQLTNTRQSSSILPTVTDVLGGTQLRIAFVSENGPGLAGELPRGQDSDRNYEIYVMTVSLGSADPSVTNLRQLTRTPAGVINDQPAISPDGAQVVWLSNAFGPLHPDVAFTPDNGTASTANVEVFLASVPFVATSPVAYRQVTRSGQNVVNDHPDVSRNASRIVFSSTALNPGNPTSALSTQSIFFSSAPSSNLPYTHNRVSAAIKAPTGRTVTAKEPSISADGRRIAFAADGCDPDTVGSCTQPQGIFQLFVADQGNSSSAQYSLAQVTTDQTRTSETPSISGDGSFITLVQTSGGSAANPDLSGSEVVFLDCPVARLEPQKTFSVTPKPLSPNLPDVGDTVQYSVTLVNRSLANFANTMIITDVLPADGLSNIVATLGPKPDGTTVSAPNLNLVDGIATWSVTNLPKGGRATVYISGVVEAGQGGETIANQVFITTTAEEVETGLLIIDPFAEVAFDVTQVDLRASLTLQKNIVREGETIEVRLTVSNTGSNALNPATNVQVTTTLPFARRSRIPGTHALYGKLQRVHRPVDNSADQPGRGSNTGNLGARAP